MRAFRWYFRWCSLTLETVVPGRKPIEGPGRSKNTVLPGTISYLAALPSLMHLRATVLLLALLLFPLQAAAQTAEQPIVQAVLFYSPSCPHCHIVIDELLIPMQEQYGDQLQLVGIDTSLLAGDELYDEAIELFEIPQNRLGVPTLIVSDVVLVGSLEIPARFPELVEEGLSAGGIGWPDIPGLAVAIPNLPPSAEPNAEPEAEVPATAELETIPQNPEPVSVPTTLPSSEPLSGAAPENEVDPTATAPASALPVQSLENMNSEAISPESEVPPLDPVGFGLAKVVLFSMVLALIYTARLIIEPLLSPAKVPTATYNLSSAVPALALIGLGTALYLSYVEITHLEAICGPVGHCNIVQSSPHAQLMGIPIAVLGALSYIGIIFLWIGQRILPDRLSALSLLSLVMLTIFGTGFSIYLTLLELFVIQAICAWCLSSAVIMTLLMILVARSVNGRPLQLKVATQM